MTPAFSARRRADEFEALVSSSDPAPLTERDVRNFAALLAVVDDLRAVPEVTARAEFVGDLRERLMAAADTAMVPTGAATRPRVPAHESLRSPRRNRRLSALLGGAALVGATATVAVAAQTALPGESLYPVKRGIESAQLQFVSGADRGHAQLANAADRLTELEALSRQDDDARTATLAADTLESFTEQADEGGELLLQAYANTDDRSLVEEVNAFNATSMGRLTDLESALPAESTDALSEAAQALVELDRRAMNACAVCSGGLTQASVPRELVIDLAAALPPQTVPGTASIGQEVDGLEIPELEVPPDVTDGDKLPALPLPGSPSSTKTPGEVLSGTPGKVEETLKGTGETLNGTEETLNGTTEAVEGITNGLTGTIDGTTGGKVYNVTEWLDYLSSGVTDPVEPGGTTTPENVLPDTSLPDGSLEDNTETDDPSSQLP